MNPDDGIVDPVAVDRAVRGWPIRLTAGEQRAAVGLATARGMPTADIAHTLGIDHGQALRWRRASIRTSRSTA